MAQEGESAPVAQTSKKRLWTKRFVSDIAVALLLFLLTSVIWITNSDLWSKANWDVPAGYVGDNLQILGWIKAASEGDYHLLDIIYVSRLGAPFGANWNDYPMYEKAFTILLGWLARSIGVMAAANVGMMLTHATAAASFYLACRWFRWSRIWCLFGALLFGFLYYNTMRALGHLLLGLTYTIPWAVLTTWLIASRHRIKRFSRAWKFCVITAFLMGVSNPYYLNIFVQFLLFSLLLQWLINRRRENLQTGLICLGVSVGGFLLAHTGTLLFRFYSGANPYAIARTYREAELYALRPIELIIPPLDHRLKWFADTGLRYLNETLHRGEMFAPYLGVLCALALAGLTVLSIRRLLQNQSAKVPLAFWQILWVLAYSVIGGVNCWLAYCGIGVFRASNRNSLYIAAILLLWLIPWLARSTRNWPRFKVTAFALLLAVGAIADQLPYVDREAKRPVLRAQVEDDQKFSQELESRLPASAMVFQLPLSAFPEGNPIMEMDSYEHLRPYYFTKSLRFTYGSNKGRSDSSWQAETERMSAREMVKRLESLGFHALLINRKAYVDSAAGLVSFLDKLGYHERLENQAHDLVAILLHPAKEPVLPRTDSYGINHFGQFWRRFDYNEDDVVWISQAYAEIQPNPDVFKTGKMHIKARLMVPNERTVSFMIGAEVFAKKLLPNDQAFEVQFDVDVPKGGKLLRIETDRPPASFQNSPVLNGTFALLSFELTPVP